MTRFLIVIAGISFASSLFVRMTDPMVPQIAAALDVNVQAAALLGTAFALPWAIMQPILGPLADMVGKTRVITSCVIILGVSAVVGALAPNFQVLLVSRIIAGAAGGGVFPVSVALIGDMVPMQTRQVAIARLLIGSIGGMLVGATGAGILADFIGWRAVFVTVAIAMAFAGARRDHQPARARIKAARPRQFVQRVCELRGGVRQSTRQSLLSRGVHRSSKGANCNERRRNDRVSLSGRMATIENVIGWSPRELARGRYCSSIRRISTRFSALSGVGSR